MAANGVIMKTYLYNFLLWLDEGLNTLLVPIIRRAFSLPLVDAEGKANFTVSQTMAELRQIGSKFGCVACKVLTFIWKLWVRTPNYDHCTDALQGMPEDITEG